MDESNNAICQKCNTEITSETSARVICDKCQSSFHEECVKVNDNMLVWSCIVCNKGEGSHLKPPGAPHSKRSNSKISSRHTNSTRSSKTKQQMLEALAEEKALLERQAKEKELLLNQTHEKQLELMRKKQEAIQEIASSRSSSSSRSSLKDAIVINSDEKVTNWIQSTQANAVQEITNKAANNQDQNGIHFSKQITHSSTQLQLPGTSHVKLNVQEPALGPNLELPRPENRRHLSREEIAARHVVKGLPEFDGNSRSWPRFISSFYRSTKICGFNNLENLERLNKCLIGNAYDAVKSSLMMEDNVPRILQTLELLFGKPEFIINSLLDELRKSSPPTFENIDSILRYSLEIENISMTMVHAKLSEHVWNPILLSEIVERLPSQLKFDWATYKYNNSPCSIEVFSMWLKNKAVTYASVLTKPPNIRSSSKKESRHSMHVHQEVKRCLICSKDCTSISNCSKFMDLTLQDKWDKIRRFQICRICLSKHPRRRCDIDTVCGIDGCQFRHNQILHQKKENSPQAESVQPISDGQEEESSPINIHADVTTYFKVLPVFLTNGNHKIMVYAMLDDGSSLTLLDKSVALALNLEGEKQPLCLRWTNGMERRESASEIVSFNISQFSEGRQFKLRDVRTVENISLPHQSVNMDLLSSTYGHLEDVNLKSFENIQPLLLIGLNNSKLLTVQKYRIGNDDEPSAARTALGWCVYGAGTKSNGTLLHIKHCQCEEKLNKRLEDMIQENYTLEAIGISAPSSLPQAKADRKAIEILTNTVKFHDCRFEIGLLWRYDDVNLPNNLHMAKRRLHCLEKKFDSEPQLRNVINMQIKDYISKGYAKKLHSSAIQEIGVWYLPIFVVRNENKPDKVRMVWDAAAEVNGVSLNHMLLKGPDLLTSLPGVLLRFREHQVAITGDIKEMFHQVRVRECDRKYQRFLWRSNSTSEIDVYEMCVMTFGACCSPSCAQYVKNLNADQFRDKFPKAVDAILSNHYVDDWLQSVDSATAAVTLAKEVKDIHAKGGFEIHKWISNDRKVVESLNSNSSYTEKNMELSPKFETNKILGMFWSTATDSFQYVLKLNESNAKLINGETIPTKRSFLKFLMSIFDPMGLISPVLVYPKILLQGVWRSRIDWDDEIGSEHYNKWMEWAQNLHFLTNLRIPRWVGLYSTGTDIEIHTFVDASEDAFAAAVYFKVNNDAGTQCSLIMSKSRVAPLKSLSVPRLELQAAVLGVRIAKFVMDNTSTTHVFTKRFYWTDSETVIKWLNSDSRKYSQYVSCRIGEILESSSQSEWNWIAGRTNIADMSTKMRNFDEPQMEEWFHGPSILYQKSPTFRVPDEKICEEELRLQTKVNCIAVHQETEFRVGRWKKLRRVIAFVYRYVSNLRKRVKGELVIAAPLTSEEYRKAEQFLIRKAQMEEFSEEYNQIAEGKFIVNKQSVIFKESPFMDCNGILRAKGRIQSSPYVPYDTKNPILLPRNHRVTEMILNFYHERYHHLYVATVANEIKQKFVVQRLKIKLKEIRRNCQVCKNRDAQPQVPEECQLPPARLHSHTRPFTHVGIDYFGPLQVAVGRRREKRWCMLVTCLTTRAIHLEVAHSLTSESCILGLRRFMSRRGKPSEIYTDNGTNFKGSKRELREIWQNIDKQQLADTFIDPDTEWKFIPPASPHMGGAWERMVRTVKTSLKAAFPFRIPNDELLLTMLSEVENVINNRPLTYVELENEYQEALTPNHFLLGSSSGLKPLGEVKDDSAYLRENYHKAQRFADVFWKRWVEEYLPTLNRRTKWFQSPAGELKEGDVVIVLGEEKRGSWPKGRVLELHRSKDNKVRSASVLLETGIYTRPVAKLAVLDIRGTENEGTLGVAARIPGGSVTSTDNTQ